MEIKIRRSNVTDIAFLSTELGPKRLGLLKELGPGAPRYAALVNPNSPANQTIAADLRAAAAAIGKQIDTSLAEYCAKRGRCTRCPRWLVVSPIAAFKLPRWQRITAFLRCITIANGELMTTAPIFGNASRQGGIYVGPILKGEKAGRPPSDSDGQVRHQLQTARTLGLTIAVCCSA